MHWALLTLPDELVLRFFSPLSPHQYSNFAQTPLGKRRSSTLFLFLPSQSFPWTLHYSRGMQWNTSWKIQWHLLDNDTTIRYAKTMTLFSSTMCAQWVHLLYLDSGNGQSALVSHVQHLGIAFRALKATQSSLSFTQESTSLPFLFSLSGPDEFAIWSKGFRISFSARRPLVFCLWYLIFSIEAFSRLSRIVTLFWFLAGSSWGR